MAVSLAKKFGGYAIVTVIAAPANLILYSALLSLTNWHPSIANLTAAMCVAIPSFFANRQLVWQVRSTESLRYQMLLYWAFTAFNVTCSSIVAWILAGRGASNTTLVVATLGVYATTWLLRFFFLDKVLFKDSSAAPVQVSGAPPG